MSKKVSRQIGWSNESNLLYQILNQLSYLGSIIFNLKPKYKVYSALLTQSGINPPVANVLENTIGDITYSYVDEGKYQIICTTPSFTQFKTMVQLQLWEADTETPRTGIVYWGDEYTLNLINAEPNGAPINNIGSGTFLTSIEIRVYN